MLYSKVQYRSHLLEEGRRLSDIFSLMLSASTASWASLEARSPSAEIQRALGGGMTGPGPGVLTPLTFLLGVCKENCQKLLITSGRHAADLCMSQSRFIVCLCFYKQLSPSHCVVQLLPQEQTACPGLAEGR